MIPEDLSTSVYLEERKGSLRVGQLEQCQAFLRRLGQLDRCFRQLLEHHIEVASSRMELDKLSHQYLSNVYRASEALLNGRSQVEQQVFKFQFNQETDALPDIIPTSRTTIPRLGS